MVLPGSRRRLAPEVAGPGGGRPGRQTRSLRFSATENAMSRRRKKKLPREPLALRVDDLSHDGRGVATHADKRVFVRGALPGERVRVRVTGSRRRYDEGETLEVIEASPHRIPPRCPHFGVCGGCSLQRLDPAQQIAAKHNTLQQNLVRIGKVEPDVLWEPLSGPQWGYRRKARLSVRYVRAKKRVLVGFRETYGRFVADMQEFEVKISSLPLPVVNVAPWEPVVSEAHPEIAVTLGDLDAAMDQFACFVGGQGRVPVRWIGENRTFTVRPQRPLGPGRHRINCTVPGKDGRFYWYSHPWFVQAP